MNFKITIMDIDNSVQTGVLMTLVGYVINKLRKENAEYKSDNGWWCNFEVDDPNTIIKRAVCGCSEDGELYYICINPNDIAWKRIMEINTTKSIKIEDLLESGIERKGGG